MQERKCFQCNNQLLSKVGGEPIKCSNCGASNEGIDQHKSRKSLKRSSKKHRSSDDSLIGEIFDAGIGN